MISADRSNPFNFEERNSISSAILASNEKHRMPSISSRGGIKESHYKTMNNGFMGKLAQDSTQSVVAG